MSASHICTALIKRGILIDMSSHERGLPDRSLPCILDSVSGLTGTVLSLTGPANGESRSSWHVIDNDGVQHILKIHPDPDMAIQFEHASTITDGLRELPYPIPRHIAHGSCAAGAWQLIEWLPGRSHQPLTASTFQQVIQLNHLQRSLAINQNPAWIEDMVSSVLDGCDGYCEVDTLRQHSERTRDLLQTLQSWAQNARDVEVDGTDIVHYDFHPGNILIADESITSVIDWTGSCAGDATFDLCTLLFYCYDEQPWSDLLMREILGQTEIQALRLYLSHMILRQVDWSIRHHNPSTVDHYLNRAYRILADITWS
jgi:aminoglycoside phosphotransferase (APT) family kinase protein